MTDTCHGMRRDSTKTVLGIGFAMVMALMLVVAFASLSMLHSSGQRIEQLVNANNTKLSLIHQMRSAARERTVSLQNMIILEDPFRQDEEWMQINASGADFAVARLALLALNLSDEERRLLEQQADLTRGVAELHLEIAALVLAGDKDRAFHLLHTQAMPGQQQTFDLLSRLLGRQADSAARAVREAERHYRHTLVWILGLIAGIAALSLLIARTVMRRTAETEQRLYSATEHAQVTLHSIGDGVITTDRQGRIEQLNPEAERLTGWTAQQAALRPVAQVFSAYPEQAPDRQVDPVGTALEQRRVLSSAGDLMLKGRHGRSFAIEYSAAPIFTQRHDTPTGAVLVFRDVSQVRLIANELAYQAKHDMLTGLMNRREFEHHLQSALGRIPQHTDEPHWLCYLDLDQFKLVNDTCGHLAGDELLKQIARALQLQIRDTDLLARTGGDEFAILLSRCSAEAANHIIERIRHAVTVLRFVWNDKAFRISSSFGLVPITPENGTLYELMSAADMACYVAKDAGRNRIHVYHSGDGDAARRSDEMHWVQRITQALEEDRFVLYHQPIVPLRGSAYAVHSEILVRMLSEDKTVIPPLEFIPAAERYNLMARVDRWVIRRTLKTLHTLLLRAPAGSCTLAINLSGQSLCDDEFLPFVLQELDRHHLDPQHLCFEITETSAISNLSRATHFISTLRARGCRFALDDFGSGLSSFGYLKNLAVDYLKIDGSFVRNIDQDAMDFALVDSINQIGHVAGMQTVAEYVENPAIQEKLRKLGVDYVQGYAIARPKPLHLLRPVAARRMTGSDAEA